jgi:hypothetical protein
MEELREMEAPSFYLTGLLRNPSFTPRYNLVKPLSPKALWSNLVSSSSDGHNASSSVASPRRELPDAVTCRLFLLGTSVWVLRPKPVNPPPNLLASSVVHSQVASRLHLSEFKKKYYKPSLFRGSNIVHTYFIGFEYIAS